MASQLLGIKPLCELTVAYYQLDAWEQILIQKQPCSHKQMNLNCRP